MHRLAATASTLLLGLALVPALALAQQPAPQVPQPAPQAQPQAVQQSAPAPEAPAQQAVPAPRIVLPVVVIALPAPLVTPAASMAIRDAIVAGLAPAAGGRPVVALPDEARIAAIATCHDAICFGARLNELQAITGVIVRTTRRNRTAPLEVRVEMLDPVSGAPRVTEPIVVQIPAAAEAAPAALLAPAIAQMLPALPSPPPPPPTLLIVTNVDDALVTIDGRELGHAPVGVVEIPPGRYNIVVTARGWATGSRMVQVGETGSTRADFDLEPEQQTRVALDSGRSWATSDGDAAPSDGGEETPIYLRWYTIAGAAAVVVAIVVIAVVVAGSGGTEVGPPQGIPVPPITSP